MEQAADVYGIKIKYIALYHLDIYRGLSLICGAMDGEFAKLASAQHPDGPPARVLH